jgi:integrase
MLPPYSENPFTRFPIDQMRDADGQDEGSLIFTADQQRAFFAACNEWQRGLFQILVTYGLRVGELTNLLIENVDFTAGTIQICSKPELYWRVKTSRRRMLPLTKETRELIQERIGERKSGFVFLNEEFANGTKKTRSSFSSDRAFREHLKRVADDYSEQHPDSTEKDLRRLITANCRAMGQIPVKRVQHEFCKLTKQIGCPDFTKAHDLRHLFSSRAQEEGMNPILVQELLGHATLTMTKRYTHLGIDAKRQALEKLTSNTVTPASQATDPS